jgi:hypothetical protein
MVSKRLNRQSDGKLGAGLEGRSSLLYGVMLHIRSPHQLIGNPYEDLH